MDIRQYQIRFKQGDLAVLRSRLLADLSNEHFAILFGKTWSSGWLSGINVLDLNFLQPSAYESHSRTHLRVRKEVVHNLLSQLSHRYDANTMIDVHTHPFSRDAVGFSSVDDADERRFGAFLADRFDSMHYASIVLSQEEYSARFWIKAGSRVQPAQALIRTQTRPELIPSSDLPIELDTSEALTSPTGVFHRSALALGVEHLRSIMSGQSVTIVGVGGLGSIVAEHLIHMGFQSISLIDPDVVEYSNLNRLVGVYYSDAESGSAKVDAVRRHLLRINPSAHVDAHRLDVLDPAAESILARSDWIIVATDNHASRLRAQKLALQYFVPLISVGVNISVRDDRVQDMSGEVITARAGDQLCLVCLNRINHLRIAEETHPSPHVRSELVRRGYIDGHNFKEPAVKTLNSILATLAVDTLVNQYTGNQKHVPVLVYENTIAKSIYRDTASVEARPKHCFTCSI